MAVDEGHQVEDAKSMFKLNKIKSHKTKIVPLRVVAASCPAEMLKSKIYLIKSVSRLWQLYSPLSTALTLV